MNKVIPLIAFSVLLLVPVGAQNAFAINGLVQFSDSCAFGIVSPSFQQPNQVEVQNTGPATQITISSTGSVVGGPAMIGPGGSIFFSAVSTGPFTVSCADPITGNTAITTGNVLPASICGNGIPEIGEQCDTGGESATCDADCTFVQCGDGDVNNLAGEQCDDGNNDNGDTCTNLCLAAVCGDGIIWDANDIPPGPEQCDDGNFVDGDGCSLSCEVEAGAGFDCGPKTEPIAGICVPKLDEICMTGTIVEPVEMMTCIAQSMGSMIGGELLNINTVSLLIASIGVNPVITGLVGITIAGVAGQIVWFFHKRKKTART